MRADEDKRLGEFMDAFVSRSGSQPGSASERKAAEAISVSTVIDPSEVLHVDVHTVMPVESVAATTVHVIDSSDGACSEESDCTNTEFGHYLDQKETNSGAEIASNFKCSTIPFASVSISAEEATGTIDPLRLVGQKLSLLEKEHIIKLGPCQPSKSDLMATKVKCGADKYRYCSQKVFFHPDNTKRQWVSYSQSKNALFCIPCLLFTDASLRGEHQRVKQGNAFTMNGYSNWKKQCSGIARHEGSSAHQNAVLAQAIFFAGPNDH